MKYLKSVCQVVQLNESESGEFFTPTDPSTWFNIDEINDWLIDLNDVDGVNLSKFHAYSSNNGENVNMRFIFNFDKVSPDRWKKIKKLKTSGGNIPSIIFSISFRDVVTENNIDKLSDFWNLITEFVHRCQEKYNVYLAQHDDYKNMVNITITNK